MKSFILLFLILSLSNFPNASAQETRDRGIPPAHSHSASQRPSSSQNLEIELQKLLSLYSQASIPQKEAIRKQITENLSKQFDQSLREKEQKARQLRDTLAIVETTNNLSEIEDLKKAIQYIEDVCAYRRENRDQIIANRLKEMLEN
ncbi:hypothetical protein [Pontibacter sp. G13]|uniref:hypothetical protein n=1 Tax=Pontibacter sp. G13 TaxID=3074898 RepID=UPI0028892933|nr:hypothetical protein [Pontibacter sp. G13]WNJ19885.1 hypothetical protein RJD25_05325 [Pontibacter sp. G13]